MEDYYVETWEDYSIFKSPAIGYYWQGFVWFDTIEECRASIAAWNRRFETVLTRLRLGRGAPAWGRPDAGLCVNPIAFA